MREEGGAAGGGDGRVEVTDINPAGEGCSSIG